MKSCREVQRKMYEHFPVAVDHPLNTFISKNLMHILVEPTNLTSILLS